MRTYHYCYHVRLEDQQRRFLETMVQMSRTPVKHYLVARVLLMSDQSLSEPEATDGQIAEALSIYEMFPPEQAKALIDRLEIHYTPKHASWLNIAEIELSVPVRQGLTHNVATIEELCRQVQSWQERRNQRLGTANWQFRTADARIKLKRLYPVQQPDA